MKEKDEELEVLQLLQGLSHETLVELLKDAKIKVKIKPSKVKKLEYQVTICHTRKCELCGDVTTFHYKATIVSDHFITSPHEVFETIPFCGMCEIVLMGMPKYEVIKRAISTAMRYNNRSLYKCETCSTDSQEEGGD
jgi:hypothetical protein